MSRGAEVTSARAGIVRSDQCETTDIAVSTRTYIVLAALTGVVILVAFALQAILVNR
jgi:preprotein translocase subunit Sec61beta